MPLSDIVTIEIVTESASPTQAGFGLILILSADADFPERRRLYTSLAGVGEDFDTDSPTYGMAGAIFSQNPRVTKVMVGRMVDKPTQKWTIDLGSAGALEETLYQIQIGSQIASYTSDVGDVEADILGGLMAAVNALAAPALDLTASGGVTSLVLTADNPGDWFRVVCLNPDSLPDNGTYLSIVQDSIDFGVEDELNDILGVDSSFYAVVCPFQSEAIGTEIADWAEANEKLYVASVQDSATITAAVGGTDWADDFKDAAYARSALIYHPDNGEFADAAWLGKCLPFDPGSETWKFKTLAGVSSVILSPTHQVNLEAKRCNYYYEVAGINITTQGVVSANEYVDVVRFRDWLKARISESVFALLVSMKKVPYTDRGIAMIQGRVSAVLKQGVEVGGLSEDPAPEVTVPKVVDVDDADKAARVLRNVNFFGTLAGAIHSLEIQGTISV